MRKKHVFLIISLLFYILFFLFTFIIKKHLLDSFDFTTTVRIQDHTPIKIDRYFSVLSTFASIEGWGMILFLVLLFYKKIRSFITLGIFFASHAVELFGKIYLHHSGPPFIFFRKEAGFNFDKSYVQPGSSYPSGHSFRTVFVSIILIYILSKQKNISPLLKWIISIGITVLDFIILYSRISLGEHWTSDVIGGSIFGIAGGFLSLLFL